MARFVTKTYAFDVPTGIVKSRVYYVPGSQPPTYESPCIEIPGSGIDGTVSVKIPNQVPISEGTYTIGASVFDDGGNESDMGAFVTYPFDFTAPPAPSNGRIL